ncbi:hypothetical protein L7F22_048429 [Adiantum nelumboides]|nr:hypothetical protein [Adiantum nelumboides]
MDSPCMDVVLIASLCIVIIGLLDESRRGCPREEEMIVISAHALEQQVAQLLQAHKVTAARKQHASRACWAYEQLQNYLERCLFGTYSDAMFKKCMCVSKQTLSFICRKVAPYMQRKDTQMHGAISLEKRVCLALHRLAIGSLLQELGDLYGCATSIACGIVTDFCLAIKKSGLHDFYIRWLDAGRMEEIALPFEAL